MMIAKALSMTVGPYVVVATAFGNLAKHSEPDQAYGWHNPGYASSPTAADAGIVTTVTLFVTTTCLTTLTVTPPECMTATEPATVPDTIITTPATSEMASVPPPIRTSEIAPSPSTSPPPVETAAAPSLVNYDISAAGAVVGAVALAVLM
ncbi:hypothetical protein MKZ38_005332 [Zalerion maritima]|uniref:Uncharacterized protein n=1 Tax=Zalerion maritima TaxID=339359 RepID=A0AAD5WWM4_9PEZI|nr:hypothetical protein MKZ38_005332 [Zalerion maritima]